MSKFEEQYLNLLRSILKEGKIRMDRTGVGTRSIFGVQLDIDLSEGFPLVTTKKIHFKSVLYELFWFIRGDTNIGYLRKNGVTIWDEWADAEGNLGPIYGYQWRRWPGYQGEHYDQLKAAIKTIKENPYSRRILVSSWNVAQLSEMRLPPCHVLYQFYPDPSTQEISMLMYQRSADVFLGLPFNIASYAILLHLVGSLTEYRPKRLILFLGDTHLYLNHIEQALTQLQRTPKPLPKIVIEPIRHDIDEYTPSDIKLVGYDAHPHIPAPVAV